MSAPRTPRARPTPGILPVLPWGLRLPEGTRGTLAWGCRGIPRRDVVDVPWDRAGAVWPESDAIPPASPPVGAASALQRHVTAAALSRAVARALRESRGADVPVMWATGRWTWRVRLAGGYAYVSVVLDEGAGAPSWYRERLPEVTP